MNDHQPIASHAHVVDRLARLRTIVSLIATDLAVARRRANELEKQNRQLTQRIAELESKLTTTPHDKPSPLEARVVLAAGAAQIARPPTATTARAISST